LDQLGEIRRWQHEFVDFNAKVVANFAHKTRAGRRGAREISVELATIDVQIAPDLRYRGLECAKQPKVRGYF
jgi:hypothetical protein